MHRGVGLGGLSMPSGWCTLWMPIYFKPWGIKEYSVSYKVQIELLMASDATVVIHRGGFLHVLFESFSEGPSGLSYIFLITCKFSTLEPVDGPTFVFHRVLILRGDQDVFNGYIALEVGLYAILTVDLLDAFT